MILTRSVVVVVFFAFGGVAWRGGLGQFDRRVVVIDVVALGLLVVAVLAAAVGHEGDGGVVGHFGADVGVDRGGDFRHQMVEPATSTVFCGMLLGWRITSGVVWKREASVAMRSRALVILVVVQVDSAWPHCARFRWNLAAFSVGSRILVCSPPVMTGRLNCGFSALNSSTDISASWAAMFRSMSPVLSTAVK